MTVLEYLKAKEEYKGMPVELIDFITDRTSYYGSYECCIANIKEAGIKHIANAIMFCDRTSVTWEKVKVFYICDIKQYDEQDIITAIIQKEKNLKEKYGK